MKPIYTKAFRMMPVDDIQIHTKNDDGTFTATLSKVIYTAEGPTNQVKVRPIEAVGCTYYVIVKLL
ncbi:MAG: hypothetical protein EOM23_01765 [Candidatus Moranbacteria bacterium]|nr:hypothetical protein [Candidatus Moranbacteria bacterium]